VFSLNILSFAFQFGEKFRRAFEQESLGGRMCRQLLQPPNQHSARKFTDPQQPYLSLRWLGSYQNLGFIAVLFVLLNMFLGIGPFGFIVFTVFFIFGVTFLRALVSPVKQTNKTSL
jgi:sphingomyelin phosphodiesterase 4